jgi:RND family efflux transporter MFP subunit
MSPMFKLSPDHLRDYFQRRMRWPMLVIIPIAIAAGLWATPGRSAKPEKPVRAAPALTVQVAAATTVQWPETLQVSGPIMAWQEAIIGSEISGQRLIELNVNVGDRVKKGQVLARYNAATLQAEKAELNATWQQAEADRVRAIALQGSGAMSSQQIENYTHQAAIAKARLDAKDLQLRYATVVAPDDGVISSRSATLGAVGSAGGELFRIILNGRLEWRGSLNALQLGQIKAGHTVLLALPDGSKARAKVRQLSPSLDAQTRMATVYADLQPGSRAHAGMYANGIIAMQTRPALVVPAVSVVIRDGRSYVFTADTSRKNDAGYKVTQQPVTTNRHQGDEVEVTAGLHEGVHVVMQGAGFLNDGDVVRVVDALDKQP